MGRRLSREVAMKLLYQTEIQKDHSSQLVSRLLSEYGNLDDNDRAYITTIINGIFENLPFIDSTIEKYLKNWNIDRIPKLDLCILRISCYEINFRHDIPFSVSVNEAVELSKKYSTKESSSFINGVLAKVIKDTSNPDPGGGK